MTASKPLAHCRVYAKRSTGFTEWLEQQGATVIAAERGRELTLESPAPSKPGSSASTQVSARPPAMMDPVRKSTGPLDRLQRTQRRSRVGEEEGRS